MKGPIYVDWAITTICNLHCHHCVGMEQGELNHAQAIKVAKDIIGLAPQWVILEGGEPLLRNDLHIVGDMFHKAGIDVFVITNGNAFTEEALKRLTLFSPKVLFSIDGANAAIYEYTKTGANFEVARTWAKRCAEVGIFHGITTVLSRLNIGQVSELIKLDESMGGKRIIFLPLKPFGTDPAALDYYRQYALTPAEQEQAIRKIYSQQTSLDIFYDEPFLWNVAERAGFTLSNKDSGITIPEVKGCAAAYSLYIQTDGSIRPCMFSHDAFTFGNAAEEPLAEIWLRMKQSSTLTGWANQSQRKGACARCPQFESCRGCLARTTRLSGDSLQSDPSCPCVQQPVAPY